MWKMIFLCKWMIFRFRVNFAGYKYFFQFSRKEKHVVLSTFWGKDPWTELLGTQLDLTKPAPNQKNVTDTSAEMSSFQPGCSILHHVQHHHHVRWFSLLSLYPGHSIGCWKWPFCPMHVILRYYLKGELGEVMCLQGENLDLHCTHIQQESTHLLKHQGISEEAKRWFPQGTDLEVTKSATPPDPVASG